jgi:hypothetical protein
MLQLLQKDKELRLDQVKDLWEHYQRKSKNFPNFGKLQNGGVTITLPSSMCWDWANKCAGDSGGKKPRPVGIRIEPGVVKQDFGTQENALKKIWYSPESLMTAIKTYGGGGAEHLANKIARKLEKTRAISVSKTLNRGFDIQDIKLRKMCVQILDIAIENKDILVIRHILENRLDQFKTS